MDTPLAEALADYRDRLHSASEPVARGSRRRVWVVGFLAAATLAGGAFVTLHGGPSPAAPTSPATASGGGSIQGLEKLDDLIGPTTADAEDGASEDPLLTAAPQTDWRQWSSPVLTVSMPASDEAGPRDGDPGRLAGFAHTPTGALFAAASLHPAIYYTRDRDDWRALAEERVVWVPGARDALLTQLEAQWDASDSGVGLTPAGFRMLSYSPSQCEVRLWWSLTRPGAAEVTVGAIVTVQWVAGDWWLWFSEASMDMRQLAPARDSFTAWGPA